MIKRRNKNIKIFIYFILLIILIIFFINSITYFTLREDSQKFPQIDIKYNWNYFPYETNDSNWFKANFHAHSDELLFYYERHPPELIRSLYKSYNYDIITISDYNTLTDRNFKNSIQVYEWGFNILKRHFLIFEPKKIIPDFFPLFSSIQNLQWIINHLKETSNFIVLNHPKLRNAYQLKDILELQGFQAIEVFTPFGDSIDLWDQILTNHKPVFAFSSDDLHYFSDEILDNLSVREPILKKIYRKLAILKTKIGGEAFQRYLLIQAKSLDKNDIINSLCKGNFVAIKQFFPNMNFSYQIEYIKTDSKIFKIQFRHTVQKIMFKTSHNKILREIYNSDHASFELESLMEPFLRIEVVDIRGILLTNPVFRLNKNIKDFCEN